MNNEEKNENIEAQASSKKVSKKPLKNLLKNKYLWFTLAAIGISGTYIAIDVMKDKEETIIKNANKEELLSGVVNYVDSMNSLTIKTEIDMFVKHSQNNVTKPYMIGQAVTFDVLNKEEPMIHGDGKTVFQANGKRDTKIYERYETIGAEKTSALENREDLIWIKKEYQNQPNIVNGLEVFKLIKENEESFEIKKLFKIDGRQCYMLEGELQYADLLPYLTDMVCFENGDNLLEKITRNGFYGFVQVYINVDTGLPERLYIDFSETGRAFAEVDGGNEGWSAQIGSFYFKLDFKNHNKIENIEVDLSVKENAIDEMIFWERLKNNDLTYEELIFYQMLFNYNLSEFDFYMQKLGVTEEEYNTFLALFNFDVYGNSSFPMLTQIQFDYLKELFSVNLGFEYYHKLLGITQSEYEYYLKFFSQVKEYGNYHLFEGISQPQFEYYQQILNLSTGSYETYEHIMQHVQSTYQYKIPDIKESEFEYILNLFSQNHDYEYFKQKFNWTENEYKYMQQVYEFLTKYYYNITQHNVNITSKYDCFKVLSYITQNYNVNTDFFSYNQNEFIYYITLFDYVGTYDNYGDYVINNIYKSNEYEYFINNYVVNNMNQAQFKYYYELILLTNNNAAAYKNIIEFISSNYDYKFKEMNQKEFEYFLNFFSKNNISYDICKNEFNWTQKEYDFYKAMYELIIKNQESVLNNNVNYKTEYEYYQAIIESMKDYYIYMDDFKYNQIEFEYYVAMFKYNPTYQDYKNYVTSIDYATATHDYYKTVYNIISKTNNNFTSFEEFYEYVQTIDYNTFVQEFKIASFANIYDNNVEDEKELNSGVNQDTELSNNWYSYSFKYNNYVIGLPVSYNEFLNATGFSLNNSDSNSNVSAGNSVTKTLYKNGTSDSISIVISNESKMDINVKNCNITSISISQTLKEEERNKFILPSGVTLGMSLEEVTAKYGEPFNKQTNGGLTNITYRSNGKNETMKMIFSNNKLTKVTFNLTK
jgi:hypothetical protein